MSETTPEQQKIINKIAVEIVKDKFRRAFPSKFSGYLSNLPEIPIDQLIAEKQSLRLDYYLEMDTPELAKAYAEARQRVLQQEQKQ